MNPVYIGSQLFINKTDTPEMVRNWVALMDENVLKIIRLFMVWDQLEPKENEWDFTNYDACFNEAENRGMWVVPTLMSVSPPGWMRLTSAMQVTANLDEASFWKDAASQYTKKIVGRYCKSPALHSWILWNEAIRYIGSNDHSTAAYRQYLKKIYSNKIELLNEKYYKQYLNFDEIELDDRLSTGSYPERIDRINFTVANLMEKLNDIANDIKSIDDHPIHINPAGIGHNALQGGQSIWKEAEFTDFIGCSTHPTFHSRRFPASRIHQSVSYFADLMKSATLDENKLFWVTELQGGPTLFSSPGYTCPSPQDIKTWLWENIASGAKAVVYWCFNSRNYGIEGGEWSLLNRLGKPSVRLLESKKVAETLHKYNDIFSKTKPIEGQVAILYSEDSWTLDNVLGLNAGEDINNPRNRQMGADAVAGAYLMCSDLGLTVSIINGKKLLSNEWQENTRVLIIPSVTAMDEAGLDAVCKFAYDGGTVIADGMFAMKDPYGLVMRYDKQLNNLFGMLVEDAEGAGDDLTIECEDSADNFPAWFVKIIPEVSTGKVLKKFNDGQAAVISNKCGKGIAIRIGTVFFQRYLSRQNPGAVKFFNDLLPSDVFDQPVILYNASCDLRLRRLNHIEGEVLFLLNKSSKTKALLKIRENGKLIELKENGHEYETSPGGLLEIQIVAGDILLFLWRKFI